MAEYHIAFAVIGGDKSRKAFTQFAERMKSAEMALFPVSEQTYNELYARVESEHFEKEKLTELPKYREINEKRAKEYAEKKAKEKEQVMDCYKFRRQE